MTYEQIIEELKRLKSHNNTVPSEQQAEIDTNVNVEVEELNATIEDYNEKISALEAKIADETNYQYNNEDEERDLTIELLEESFENQLEVMAREDEEYKSLQDLATSIFTDYNLEIATLNNEIAAIERRLRKNDIAVRKNIGIKLTDEELFALNSDLEQKRARIQECEEMKAKYVEDLSNYEELITANNRKREIVLSKQESLNKIKEHRASKVGSIDNAKLRNDKDELASLKAGIAALNSRKDYITYNPNAEIDKLIEAIEQNKVQNNELKEELNVGIVTPTINELQTENEVETEEKSQNKVEDPSEDKAQSLIDAYLNGNEDLVDENKIDEPVISTPLGIPEKTSAETGISVDPNLWPVGSPDLDIEREAEIEEASEILKEKKKESWFKKKWAKWVAAGAAIAITVAILAGIKGCDGSTNEIQPDNYANDNISQSQTDENITEEKEKEFNNKYEIPSDNDKKEEKEEVKEEVKDNNSNNNNNEVKPSTPDPTPEPEIEPTPDSVPDPIPEPEPTPEPEIEPTVETGKVELEQGESITSIENILNGNINEDTVIEHGDEVGKTIDNAELKDYTGEGNAVVEFEKNEEKPSTSTSREDIIKNLEELMGGDFTFTDEGNQWLDQVSGKTR